MKVELNGDNVAFAITMGIIGMTVIACAFFKNASKLTELKKQAEKK